MLNSSILLSKASKLSAVFSIALLPVFGGADRSRIEAILGASDYFTKELLLTFLYNGLERNVMSLFGFFSSDSLFVKFSSLETILWTFEELPLSRIETYSVALL